MASLQAKFLKFWLKRQHFFGNGDYDPLATRMRMENSSPLMRLHRNVRVEAVRAGNVPALKDDNKIKRRKADRCG